MSILEVNQLKKIYTTKFGANSVTALSAITFSIEEGEFVSVMGESGSGKTTLLNLIASLDKPSGGQIILDGMNLSTIKNNQLSAFRRDNLGFVFQDFNLLDTFSIKDNILLPLVLARKNYSEMEPKLIEISEKLGIKKLLEKYPYEVSGGEKQRAAVSRALIVNPKLILADEPTGSLDSKSANNLLNLFSEINNEGQTIFMVTHSVLAASKSKRVLFIRDGKIYNQLYKGNLRNDEFYERITDTLTLMTNGGESYE